MQLSSLHIFLAMAVAQQLPQVKVHPFGVPGTSPQCRHAFSLSSDVSEFRFQYRVEVSELSIYVSGLIRDTGQAASVPAMFLFICGSSMNVACIMRCLFDVYHPQG